MLGGQGRCRGHGTRPAAVAPGMGAGSGTAGSSWAKRGKAPEDQGSPGEGTSLASRGWTPKSSAWLLISWVSLGKPLPFSS